ncbi:glycoside hydrolase family 92, partial [Bacteroides thetaiotaomicron]|nr:glycoside hydrolase family 92 [Bacteroides thetaiotaomicron]
AYQNSVMYAVTKKEAHAQKATEILVAYANTLEAIVAGDQPLLAGSMGVKFMYADEMMRYLYPQGMTDDNFDKVCTMFKKIFV